MNSDEERLEEMLKAVMETESAIAAEEETDMPDIPDLEDEQSEQPSDLSLDEISEQSADESSDSSLDEIPERTPDKSSDSSSDEIPEVPEKEIRKPTKKGMGVNPLELLAMSEEEIDEVLEKEAALGEMFSGKKEPSAPESKKAEEPSDVADDLSDIEDLLNKAENHEHIEGGAPKAGRKLPDIPDEPEEVSEEPAKKSGKKKKEKKKDKKKEKSKESGGEDKQGFGKKLASALFGSDDDELDEESETPAAGGEQKEAPADGKKGAAAKEKKKKEKKKSGPDPKKAEKEKQKKAKNAEKAKKRAEKAQKAEQAAKEKRAEKKLPKKKVFVWILLCASIGIGILLLNTIGMSTLQITEARNSFDNKDFEIAYRLLNGKKLSEEDQLLFVQASAILHIEHAEEVYEIHLKLEKMARALDDLLRGVDKYQELLRSGKDDAITPEATAHYQNILKLLQDNYGLSEEGALEINAIEGDYEYSLQIEAIVNGELYQSQADIEKQQEEEAAKYPELEDMLPEEEEYFNDSSD